MRLSVERIRGSVVERRQSSQRNRSPDPSLQVANLPRRKLIEFDDDVHPQKGSLAELFARRNRLWLADVEVWRHWQGLFRIVDRQAG
jgi:hypothetical protein